MALFISIAEAAVDLDVPLVVQPGHAEHDDALGLDHALEDPAPSRYSGWRSQHQVERLEHLLHRLVELGLTLDSDCEPRP